MRSVICLMSADLALGKIDKESLSQQSLMELLIGGFTYTFNIHESRHDSVDISRWKGITFNDGGEVTEIIWKSYRFRGTLNLEWIPQKTRLVHIAGTNFITQSI